MKPTHLLIAAVLLASPAASQEQLAHELTQAGMNEAAAQRLHAAEQEMNSAIESLVVRAGSNADAIAKLRNAQAAWAVYRDAQLATLWPFPERTWYGSVYPMCFADVKTQLTEARTRELRSMLAHEEGDVCASQWPE
jgi:uncharacterized protein YecT (DUF1311 family)